MTEAAVTREDALDCRGWVAGPRVDLDGPGVVDRVVAFARSQPDAVAVRDGGGPLTYAELGRESAGLAGALAAARVGPGAVVGLCLPRSTRLVVAMLAVLRTGAAYCALDPHWPAARRRQVFDHIGAVAVIADQAEAPGLPRIAPHARQPFEADATRELDDGFAVYYTSGSTGTPKAALTTDRAVLRTLLAPPPTYPPAPARMLSTAALPWDAYTLETWYPLLHGGTTDQTTTGLVTPQALRDAVRRGVSSVWLTASLFNLVVDEDIDAFGGLHCLLTGGERLSPRHVRAFLDRHPGIALVNGYGPVEATVFVTTHRITRADCDDPAGIPVGRPLPNTELLLANTSEPAQSTRAVEPGEVGEVLVAGDGLVREYLGGPAGGFDTVSLDGGEPRRVYRTGDLASWGADGVLRYVGRADRQLKIRGQRVEPAELEQALLATGEVRRCVAVPVPSARRPTGLAAYVVASGAVLDTGDLLARVRTRLPAVLVPRFVVAVDELPIGPTGKVDVTRLPALTGRPRAQRRGDPAAHEPGGLGARIAAIASDVVGTPVRADDDLKRAGLDSLGAIRLATRLYEQGFELPAEQVLRRPVPADLARIARPRGARAGAAPGGPALNPAQEAFWLDDLLRPERAAANLVLLGYRFTPPVDAAALAAAVRAVVDRQPALRTAISMDEDGAPQPLLLDAAVAAEVEVIMTATDLAAPATRVDLAQGPLLSARVHDGGDATELRLAVHHACFDGHSEAVLADELSAALSGRLREVTRPAAPSRRDVPVAPDWVERLARTRDMTWPAGAPSDRAHACGDVPCPLPSALYERLLVRARDAGVTPFLLVLRALGRALRELTGHSDICVGIPVVDTADPAALTRIGCHIATAAVPLGDGELDGALSELDRTWAAARTHAGAGVADLARRAGRTGRDRTSLYQVQLAWQNLPSPRWQIPGHRVEPVALRPLLPQLEMTVEFWPRPHADLDGRLEFDTCAVAPDVAGRAALLLRRELESLAADGER